MKTKVEIGNHSDVGKVRSANEDYYGSYEGVFGNLIVVCDGMGGHIGGQDASRIAVESIKDHFLKLTFNFDDSKEIALAIVKANKNILLATKKKSELTGMGSTIVLLLVKNDQVYYAHVGDSRIYMIRENQIHQLTKDHSLIQKLIDSGIVTAENAASHPQKNVIQKALGEKETVEPDIVGPMTIFKGDRFILCSDGLTTYLNNKDIIDISKNIKSQKAAEKLVATANERGGKDNITVQIVDIVKGKRLPNKQLLKLRDPKILLGLLGIVIFLIASTFIFNSLSTKQITIKSKVGEVDSTLQSDTNNVKIPEQTTEDKPETLKNKPMDTDLNSINNQPEKNNIKETKEKKIITTKAKPIIHNVQKNETVSSIAEKYKVKQDDLRKWNNIIDNKIKIGQDLKIFPTK